MFDNNPINFIKSHPYLTAGTLGLAAIVYTVGYLGKRIITWIKDKGPFIKKVDEAAREAISGANEHNNFVQEASTITSLASEIKTNSFSNKKELLKAIDQKPEILNTKINYCNYKNVYTSHLLCSGKIFSADEALNVITKHGDKITLSVVDNSNLFFDIFGEMGSGNNLLKTAIAASSPSPFGIIDGKKIVYALLELLEKEQRIKIRQTILDAKDNYPYGSMSAADFLIRCGHEDLARKAFELGATITEECLVRAVQSAGTTTHGFELLEYLFVMLSINPIKITTQVHWKIKAALLATVLPEVDDKLVDWNEKSPKISKSTLNYWRSLNTPFDGCMMPKNILKETDSYDQYNIFADFSNHYRDQRQSPWSLKCETLKNSQSRKKYMELIDFFKQIEFTIINLNQNIKIHKIPDDGNCLFNALLKAAELANIDELKGLKQEDLREVVANVEEQVINFNTEINEEILNELDMMIESAISDIPEPIKAEQKIIEKQDYIRYIRKNNQYGNLAEIVAFAINYRLNITIYKPNIPPSSYFFFTGRPTLSIYHDANHYQAVEKL